jgi:hypothetical protein
MNSVDRHLRAQYTEGIDIFRLKEICEAEKEGRLVITASEPTSERAESDVKSLQESATT